jgi:hypothetical protein
MSTSNEVRTDYVWIEEWMTRVVNEIYKSIIINKSNKGKVFAYHYFEFKQVQNQFITTAEQTFPNSKLSFNTEFCVKCLDETNVFMSFDIDEKDLLKFEEYRKKYDEDLFAMYKKRDTLEKEYEEISKSLSNKAFELDNIKTKIKEQQNYTIKYGCG